MTTLRPLDLQKRLAAESAPAVLDVRTPVEFAEVSLAGSRNLPLDELDPAQLAEDARSRPDQPVYLLCRSGQRATRAAGKLAAAGYTQIFVLEGGLLAWIAAGLPVARGSARVISLERQVRIVAGALVFTGVALGWFVHRGFFGLAAFVGAGLVFAGISDFCGMGLLLARMPWNKRI